MTSPSKSAPGAFDPNATPRHATVRPKAPSNALRDLTLLLVPIILVLVGVGAYLYWGVYGAVGKVNFPRGLRSGLAAADTLSDEYTAAGDTMVAAPPEPKRQIDPEVLRFGVLEALEPTEPGKKSGKDIWAQFAEHLAKVTGKKVEVVQAPVSATSAEKRLRDGDMHLAVVTTGAVPYMVNKAGFVPFATMGNDKGEFAFQMEILVRSSSPIKTLADLRGKKIALGSFSSLSSFKAPLVLLWENEKMLPGRDYEVSVTEQRDSIRRLIRGEFEVIAAANDLLGRIVDEEKEKQKEGKKFPKDSFRSVHKSKDYPPLCFGHAHDIKPDLAKKIREAFLGGGFKFAGTGLEPYAKIGQTRFVGVSYKKDWENVREVDRSLRELVDQNP